MADVLFLTQVLPYPLDAGPKVRAYHMLRHLARRHSVTLVSFVRPEDADAALAHLRGICQAVFTAAMRRSLRQNLRAALRGLATGLPVVIARDEMKDMMALLRGLARQQPWDVVHADQTSMAGYGLLAAHASGSRPATLLDQHNAVHVLARRMAADERRPLPRLLMQREARAFARYEAGMCLAYDAVLTVIPEDRDHLLALYPAYQQIALAPKFTVVPISVDPAQTAPVQPQPAAAPLILHLGTMFWPPNSEGVLWFARQVLPLIHERCPQARFAIVGKRPPPEVQALAADARIEVAGYVEDPTPYLQAASAFVAPVRAGSGMRVKILDAWLWGLPVVSTSIGAEGISVRPGHNILLADSAADFARATLRLLEDPALNQRLRQQGRAWVEAHYSYQAVYAQVDAVYDRLLNHRG